MKIIIAGASDVGLHLAKLLSFESQDITLIDSVKEHLTYAETHLDIRTIHGDPSALAVLKKADAGDSDMMIAVTPTETTNLMCCLLSKQLGCKRTIARVTNIEFDKYKEDVDFHSLGIDELISPEELAVKEIQLLINESAFNNSYEFEDGALTMMGTTLQESAPFVGKSVKEAAAVFSEVHFMPIAIKRAGTQTTLIPRGDTLFEAGDQVYFTSSKSGMDALNELIGYTKQEIESVMILGGGRIGKKTAEDLCQRGMRVKLVESNKEKAIKLSESLPNTLVIHGDGRNAELLLEENIGGMDVFLAVTDDSETKLPANKRKKGISCHNLVLPLLWDQLVRKSGWEVEKLWEKISFGPSKFLNQAEEKLSLNSNRWLLFDPDKEWYQSHEEKILTTSTNQPLKDKKILGKVIDCGLINQAYQND